MKNPRTGEDFTLNECLIMIADLCDVIKRLENALLSGDRDYVEEATRMRREIQYKILGKPER